MISSIFFYEPTALNNIHIEPFMIAMTWSFAGENGWMNGSMKFNSLPIWYVSKLLIISLLLFLLWINCYYYWLIIFVLSWLERGSIAETSSVVSRYDPLKRTGGWQYSELWHNFFFFASYVDEERKKKREKIHKVKEIFIFSCRTDYSPSIDIAISVNHIHLFFLSLNLFFIGHSQETKRKRQREREKWQRVCAVCDCPLFALAIDCKLLHSYLSSAAHNAYLRRRVIVISALRRKANQAAYGVVHLYTDAEVLYIDA